MDRMQDGVKDPEREHNDSFERHYNKDLDLEEGKVRVDTNCLFRLGASRNLWTLRVGNQLYIVGSLWKGPYTALKSTYYARINLSWQKSSWLICFPFDNAQYSIVLPKTRNSWWMCQLSRKVFIIFTVRANLGVFQWPILTITQTKVT